MGLHEGLVLLKDLLKLPRPIKIFIPKLGKGNNHNKENIIMKLK